MNGEHGLQIVDQLVRGTIDLDESALGALAAFAN